MFGQTGEEPTVDTVVRSAGESPAFEAGRYACDAMTAPACRGRVGYDPVVGKRIAETVAIWLGALLVLPILFVLAYFLAALQVALLVLGILAAMILAYHATVPVAAFLPGDPPHALIWVLIFLTLISPAVGWFVYGIRKRDLEAKEQEERLRRYRERRKRDASGVEE